MDPKLVRRRYGKWKGWLYLWRYKHVALKKELIVQRFAYLCSHTQSQSVMLCVGGGGRAAFLLSQIFKVFTAVFMVPWVDLGRHAVAHFWFSSFYTLWLLLNTPLPLPPPPTTWFRLCSQGFTMSFFTQFWQGPLSLGVWGRVSVLGAAFMGMAYKGGPRIRLIEPMIRGGGGINNQ